MTIKQRILVSKTWYFTAAIAVIMLLASLPSYYAKFVQLPMNQHLSTGVVLFSTLSGLISFIDAAICLGLATLLYTRKPEDRMAIFVSFFLFGYGIILAGPLELLESWFFGKTGPISLYAQYGIFTTPALAFLLLFPSGKFEPPQSRWIIYASLISLMFLLLMNYNEVYLMNTPRIKILAFFLIILTLLAFSSQLYRYFNKSTPIERQQTKVVVYGFGIWILLLSISSPIYYYLINSPQNTVDQALQNFGSILWQLGVIIIPISLTIAVIRSHLWDVDIIIRRTLIYSLLTALLGLIYLGSVIFLQGVFSLLGSQHSPIVIVLSTVAIVALVAPLRRWIQDLIDRRFYRKHYNAERTLAAFSAEMRDKIDLEQLSDRLLEVVQETIQPENVTLWLNSPRRNRTQ